jgi:2,4-dienoyl-CoA reductase-like NADH-dependent reductase (Old Yellow Enzyme family)
MTHGTTSQSRAFDVDAFGGTDIASTSGRYRDASSPGEGRQTQQLRLFEPFRLGPLDLRNRMVMLAMGARMSSDGEVSDSESEWLAARARGGVGLIITGGQMAAASGVISAWMDSRVGNTHGLVEAFRENTVETQRRRVQQVHDAGVPIIGQLLHLGRDLTRNAGLSAATSGISSSGSTTHGGSDIAHELTEAEIVTLVREFAESARLLELAGYDGVELHAAHGYLLAQFLSPLANHRRDKYGLSSTENQTRMLTEVLSAIRACCSSDFVIGVRLSVTEEVSNGLQLDDTRRIVERLETDGHIQYLSLTMGIRGNYIKDSSAPLGVAEREVAAIKAQTDLPIIMAGRITSPDVAEGLLSRGATDLVGLGRALVADANFAIKAMNGENIRPCIAFVQDCRQGVASCESTCRCAGRSCGRWPRRSRSCAARC